MNLKISKITISDNQQWLFTINKLETTTEDYIEVLHLSPIMFFTIKSANNIAQFKQRFMTGLDATLNINDSGDKSYIRVFDGWCEFFIYTACASMSCRIALDDAVDELLKFIEEYK